MAESLLRTLLDVRRARKQGPAALALRQRTRLAEMVAYARANSPYYRELYQDLPDKVEDPTLLPVTSKRELMARFDEWATDREVTIDKARTFAENPDLIGERFLGKYTLNTTSGTTGTRAPVRPLPVQSTPAAPSLSFRVENLRAIRNGMDLVVNSQSGMAFASRIMEQGMAMAGKTGTSQVKRMTEAERDRKVSQEQLPWHLRHHALFCAYAPVASPRYACAVVVEHGMGGSRTAAPIVRDILLQVQKIDPSRRAR